MLREKSGVSAMFFGESGSIDGAISTDIRASTHDG